MEPELAKEQIIRLGLVGLEGKPSNPTERIALLKAAAELLPADSDLSLKCAVTAACIEQAEAAQLRLFESIRK